MCTGPPDSPHPGRATCDTMSQPRGGCRSSASRLHAVGGRAQWAKRLVASRRTDGRHLGELGLRQLRGARAGLAVDRLLVPRNNIGVLPTLEDVGVGGRDPLGNWLSTVRRLDAPPPEPIAVDGAVKVPGLRNLELTAPYFHTGGFLTLQDVLLFYSRGGDVRPQLSADGSLEIAPLNVLDNTDEELAALEACLRALTDERVRFQRAPFDHPQLFVPDGHAGDDTEVVDDGTGRAVDRMVEIPAVGRDGGTPLPRFLRE
jgi:hypothetical protein